MSKDFVVLETRRSKGYHKADLTKFSKEDVKKALEYFNSNSYVAVRNYRAKADDQEVTEIKFQRMGAKGLVKYSLKTVLTKDDFKAIGFVESPKKNLHMTAAGCSIDSMFDVEVKEPAKKIGSKKTEKKNAEKAVAPAGDKKTPLPHPSSVKKVDTVTAAEAEEDEAEEDEAEDEKETVVAKKKTPLAAAAK